jgi:hypothetical protein
LIANRPIIKRESWYRRLIQQQNVEISDPQVRKVLSNLDDYCTSLLNWFACINSVSTSDVLNVQLVATRHFAEINKTDPHYPMKLLERPSNRDFRAFGRLVTGASASGLDKVFECLTYAPPTRGHSGLGVFVGTLYEACTLDS